MKSSEDSGLILKELFFKCYELKLNVKFTTIDLDDYEKWVDLQGEIRYILTILGETISTKQISAVTQTVHDLDLNIHAIKGFTDRISLINGNISPKSCIKLSLKGK